MKWNMKQKWNGIWNEQQNGTQNGTQNEKWQAIKWNKRSEIRIKNKIKN